VRSEELVEGRTRVGEVLEEHETALWARGPVPDHDAVGGRRAGGDEPRKDALDVQTRPEDNAPRRGDDEERREKRERLVPTLRLVSNPITAAAPRAPRASLPAGVSCRPSRYCNDAVERKSR